MKTIINKLKILVWSSCLIIVLTSSCLSKSESDRYNLTWSDVDRLYLIENLEKSHYLVKNEVINLTSEQWNWKESDTIWSIALIIEHLITHDELFSREVKVLTALPEMLPQSNSYFSTDSIIKTYENITSNNIAKSPSYLNPVNRWCTKENALNGYSRTRNSLVSFVNKTDKNLRSYYSQSGVGPTKFRDVHQLILISIAHTKRHLKQIRKIKSNSKFPKKDEHDF